MAKRTLEAIRKEITKTTCMWCHYQGLHLLHIDMYDHPYGWEVEGEERRQWLSVHCPNCEYDWSLQKLGVRR